MYIKEIVVGNQIGLHANPAKEFLKKANSFKSEIWLMKGRNKANAKSILGILSMGIVGGAVISIAADGSDESQAVDALVEMIESGFPPAEIV